MIDKVEGSEPCARKMNDSLFLFYKRVP